MNFASEENIIHQIPFPAVTICNEMKISRSFFNYSETLRKDINQTTPDEEKKRKLQYMSLLCKERTAIPKINYTDENFYSFLKKVIN